MSQHPIVEIGLHVRLVEKLPHGHLPCHDGCGRGCLRGTRRSVRAARIIDVHLPVRGAALRSTLRDVTAEYNPLPPTPIAPLRRDRTSPFGNAESAGALPHP